MPTEKRTASPEFVWRSNPKVEARAGSWYQRFVNIMRTLVPFINSPKVVVEPEGFIPNGPPGGQGVRVIRALSTSLLQIAVQIGSRGPGLFFTMELVGCKESLVSHVREATEKIPRELYEHSEFLAYVPPPKKEEEKKILSPTSVIAREKPHVSRGWDQRQSRTEMDILIRKETKGIYSWKKDGDVYVTKAALLLAHLLERYGSGAFERASVVREINLRFRCMSDIIGGTFTRMLTDNHIELTRSTLYPHRGMGYRLSGSAAGYLERFMEKLPDSATGTHIPLASKLPKIVKKYDSPSELALSALTKLSDATPREEMDGLIRKATEGDPRFVWQSLRVLPLKALFLASTLQRRGESWVTREILIRSFQERYPQIPFEWRILLRLLVREQMLETHRAGHSFTSLCECRVTFQGVAYLSKLLDLEKLRG